jgi:hypothetical protein
MLIAAIVPIKAISMIICLFIVYIPFFSFVSYQRLAKPRTSTPLQE